jgi:hypothetical protein
MRMTDPMQAVSALVKATHMPKESAFELMQDWCFEMGWPDVTEEELQVMCRDKGENKDG